MSTVIGAAEPAHPDGGAIDFGGDPYERALTAGGGILQLFSLTGGPGRRLDVGPWLHAADRTDLELLALTRGSVLDVGCGPGRLVHAAIESGRTALGIDVSPTAVGLGAERGLPLLHRSVFGPVPREGEWDAVLLLDGNIGIGGDPVELLRRCAELMSPDGRIVVETDRDPLAERAYTARMTDASGVSGAPFGWSEVGAARLPAIAASAGLAVERHWSTRGRAFSLLRVAVAPIEAAPIDAAPIETAPAEGSRG